MRATNRKLIEIVAASILLVLFVSSLGIWAVVIHHRNVAAAFLKEAAALQLRVATLEQVKQLAAQYDGHIESSTCDPHGCSYFFDFNNGWLHRLRLAPYTRFTCTLGVSDGTLVYRRVILATATATSLDFGAFVEEWLSYPKGLERRKSPFDVGFQTLGVSRDIRWRVFVSLIADATPEQHRMAYGLNLKCLSRIDGCKDAHLLLPSISWSPGAP